MKTNTYGMCTVTNGHIEKSLYAEKWLAKSAPANVDDALVDVLVTVCREREWPTLLVRALGADRPLVDCVEKLRQNLSNPETSLDALFIDRSAGEVVDAAADTVWPPLVDKAVSYTLTKPQLLESALGSSGLVPLLLHHFSRGGVFPVELGREDFLEGIFDSALKGKEDALKIVEHLDKRSGRFVLDHPECDQLLSRVSSESVQGAVEEWWRRFLYDDKVGKPPFGLCPYVLKSVRRHINRAPITLVISLLRFIPEITETEFEDWMKDIGFLWEEGDHQRLARLLVERQWKAAAKTLRWSWKSELKLVAWYARDLLSWYEGFLSPPQGAAQTALASNSNIRRGMNSIDVGIITMKEEEYEALLDKFSPINTVEGSNRDYDVAVINTDRGACRVAITRCVQQGNAYAQNTATELLNDLKPSFVIVVGIAGAVPTPDFCLGDVVVSDYIQDLTLEDTGSTSSNRRFNALGGPLHPSATRIVERLRALERATGPWNEADTIGVSRPGLGGEHTTDNEQWNAEITAALQRIEDRNAPIATAKKIASSDRLIKDPELLKEWRAVLKAVAAVEMESAGVYIPCQRNNVPVLAIRGISDIVGWKRDDAWTLYACHTAAAYTRMLISTGVFCLKS